MDVVTLRTEIKAWERDFKADNGRDPTIQDIKDRPDLAEKYKLYKKLNKAKTQPSTPPRQQSKQLISKSQAVKTEPPVVSANPFSPVKNKGNRGLHVESTRPQSNPFPTSKKERKKRELSPDPFPLIQPVASSSQVALPPQPTSAVSRARKRLRGEPVSPSPVKPKRPRVIPAGGAIPFIARRPFDSDEEHNYSGNESSGQLGPTIFEETPRKDRSGNKSFTSLFTEDDRLIQPNFFLATTKSQSASRRTTGSRPSTDTSSQSSGPPSSGQDDDDVSMRTSHAQAQTQPRTRRKQPSSAQAGPRESPFDISSRLASSRGSNLLDQASRISRPLSASGKSDTKSNASTAPSTPDNGVSKLPPTSSVPTSDAEMEKSSDSANGGDKMNLVPVSPPPPSSTSMNGYGNGNTKWKGKGKGKVDPKSYTGKRKGRGKVSTQTPTWTHAGDDSQDEGFDDQGRLPVVRTYHGQNTVPKLDKEGGAPDGVYGQEDITEDLVSGIKRRIASPDPDLPFFPSRVLQPQNGDIVVNLRDEFRTILDLNANASPLETAGGGISVRGKGEYMRHSRVVRAVRDGTRVIGMFDAARGGHIWGVGETEREADADLGTDGFQLDLEYGRGCDDYDDWEGEGVPWEVAELEHDDDETRL